VGGQRARDAPPRAVAAVAAAARARGRDRPERNVTNPTRIHNVALGTTLFALAAAVFALLP
jgi:hypothetical protein